MEKDLELQIKIFIAQELEKGTSLSDIQNMVNERFNQKMTYMDIRIIASTLDVDWRALDPNAVKKSDAADADNAVGDEQTNDDVADAAGAADAEEAGEETGKEKRGEEARAAEENPRTDHERAHCPNAQESDNGKDSDRRQKCSQRRWAYCQENA